MKILGYVMVIVGGFLLGSKCGIESLVPAVTISIGCALVFFPTINDQSSK